MVRTDAILSQQGAATTTVRTARLGAATPLGQYCVSPLDVQAIERATLAAVPPLACDELCAWLVPLDPGTVGRSHSAVPLSHAAPDLSAIAEVETSFARAGRKPVWRLPLLPAFDAMSAALTQRGYAPVQATCVQIGTVERMLNADLLDLVVEVSISPTPTPAWTSVYLGPGFDPVDGAWRVELLSRGRDTHYAVVMQGGQAVASGALSVSNGWASIHGMRTAPQSRGQGLAAAVITALAKRAAALGAERVFLQVEQGNTVAQRVYAKRGFSTAWTYQYWRLT